MSYTFISGDGSVLTADSSIVSGVVQRPIINIGSVLGTVPTTFSGSPSISGAVTISSAVTVRGVASVGSAADIYPVLIGGQGPNGNTRNINTTSNGDLKTQLHTSVVSLVDNVSNQQAIPVDQTDVGFMATPTFPYMFDGTTWDRVRGDATNGLKMYGSVQSAASVIGTVPVTQAGAWSASLVGTIPGSVVSFQGGTWQPSALGYVTRNDAVASFVGANLTTRPLMSDSAGRIVNKLFAPEESRIEGYNSVVSTSVTTLVAAAGAGLRNYITDVWVANTGASATLVTFRSQGGASVLGYTIAPAGGGSNLPGLATPIRTGANETFDIQATTATSVLYATVKGFKAP